MTTKQRTSARSSDSLADPLRRGLGDLGLDLDATQQQQILDYLDLLLRWNSRFNLTAVRDPDAMLIRHVFDSLVVLPYVTAQRPIDVGTGAGLPGLLLAIAAPQTPYTLLDSNGKKTRFLVQAKSALGLDNVSVVHERVEHYRPDSLFDTVLSRAFASLGDMIAGCQQLLEPGGQFLAMKGQYPVEELDAVRDRCSLLEVIPLQVPGLHEERCLVRISLHE